VTVWEVFPLDLGIGGDARRRLVTAALGLAFVGLVVGVARAEDKANPTGTWKWSVERNGQTFESTFKLKLEGDMLSGTLARGDRESGIEDGTYKDGEVSFMVTREFNGNKVTIKYQGKVDGDTRTSDDGCGRPSFPVPRASPPRHCRTRVDSYGSGRGLGGNNAAYNEGI
jgi:hypothetical protein